MAAKVYVGARRPFSQDGKPPSYKHRLRRPMPALMATA